MTIDVINLAVPLRRITFVEPPGSDTAPVHSGDALHAVFGGSGAMRISRGVIPSAERMILGIPLDITAVDEADLDRIPGIGPSLARRIVMFRQNNGGRMAVEDLRKVEGIGDVKFNALRKYF